MNDTAIKLVIHNYFQQFKKDWRFAVPIFLSTGLGNIFVFYVPPLIIAKLLTLLTTNQFANDQVVYLIIIMGGVWLFGEMLWRISEYLKNKIQIKGMNALLIDAMSQLLKKDITFFHNNFAGTITSRVGRYSKSYGNIIEVLSFQVFPNILAIGFIAIILWQYAPALVLTLFGLMVLSFSLIFPLIKRRKKLVTLREDAWSILNGSIADIIGNIDTVKYFAHEKFEMAHYAEKVFDHGDKYKNADNYQNFYINSLVSPLYVLINVIGIAVAIFMSQKGILPPEAAFITFSYYANFTRIMWDFSYIYKGLEGNITEGAQFTELLLTAPKVVDQENPNKFISSSQAHSINSGQASTIEFQDISFRYQDQNQEYLFNKFNLKINKGEKIGLVGHSGGGKTTITKLLLRFMDIESGKILIDDQNIAEMSQFDLRKTIGYVPQEPLMFHRSILENIRYGNLQASLEEIYQAADMANATEFIEKLSHKYETLVGERGIKLSGGQRQRIAIARAILKNAPILVLDEATSSLDSENEKLIQQALWKLIEGRTTIVIAHRLSTIQKMDRIVVLEDGKISEEGSHKELLLKNGIYANLWNHQSGGFLEE